MSTEPKPEMTYAMETYEYMKNELERARDEARDAARDSGKHIREKHEVLARLHEQEDIVRRLESEREEYFRVIESLVDFADSLLDSNYHAIGREIKKRVGRDD